MNVVEKCYIFCLRIVVIHLYARTWTNSVTEKNAPTYEVPLHQVRDFCLSCSPVSSLVVPRTQHMLNKHLMNE